MKPYPIDAVMTKETAKVEMSIVMLNSRGFVAQVKTGIPYVGIHYQCQFEIPLSRVPIQTEVQVFKTFDKAQNAKGSAVERMTEVLFIGLKEEIKAKIDSFNQSIRQRN
ncbi:MAG: hypothetical protein AB7F86_08980 [Bdellovibrionales bacterium]